MTFPVIADAATTVQTSNSSSWTLNVPAHDSGDILIMAISMDGNPTVNSLGAVNGVAWTTITNTPNGTANKLFIAWLRATSNQATPITVTLSLSASEQGVSRCRRITGAHASTAPVAGTAATGSSNAPNPPSLNPSTWDVEDTLWLTNVSTDAAVTATAFPSNMDTGSGFSDVSGGGNGAGLHSCPVGSATASFDPNTFTLSASETWVAQTVAVRPAPGNYVVDAQPGSFTETGAAATLQRGFELNAQPGSFALTGTDATPQHGYKVTAEWGRIFISSPADKASEYLRANEFGTSLTLSAVGDAAGQCFTSLVTGPLTELAFKVFKGVATLMTVVARIYAVTGTVGVDAIPTGSPLAESTHSIVVSLSNFQELHFSFSGAFSLTQGTDYAAVLYVTEYTSSAMGPQSFDDSPHSGNAAWNDGSGWVAMSGDTHHGVYVNGVALIADRVINAEPGSLVLTGFAATLARGFQIDAQPGSFALTGVEADLVVPAGNFTLDAVPGDFSLTGTDATTAAGRVLNAESGAFVLTGALAELIKGSVVDAQPGSFTLTGSAAALIADRVLSADPGALILTGAVAGLVAERLIVADPGVYVVTGFDAALVFSGAAQAFEINAEPGVFVVTGVDAGLLVGRVLDAQPGSFTVTGVAAALVAERLLNAEPGALALTGFNAWAGLNLEQFPTGGGDEFINIVNE